MSYKATKRDRLARWAANWILTHVATFEYQTYVYVLVKRGEVSLRAELDVTPNDQ